MKNVQLNLELKKIESRIFTIRDKQVMLDTHLAELFNVELKVLNQSIKRNSNRFPQSFRFQLNKNESENLRSQFVTSSLEHGGRRYLPYVFTEQGVAMLSAILRSDIAILTSIQIMEAFVEMRKLINTNSLIDLRISKLENKQLDSDKNFEQIFQALENKDLKPDKGILFEKLKNQLF